MDEESAFLTAIRNNPSDDTVRLAYADWLIDQDAEPADDIVGYRRGRRGHFIRCDVLKLPHPTGGYVWSYILLGVFDTRILEAADLWHNGNYSAFGDRRNPNHPVWDKYDGAPRLAVRRGFVDEVELPWRCLLDVLPWLVDNYPVRSVRVTDLIPDNRRPAGARTGVSWWWGFDGNGSVASKGSYVRSEWVPYLGKVHSRDPDSWHGDYRWYYSNHTAADHALGDAILGWARNEVDQRRKAGTPVKWEYFHRAGG